jgi:hypothetical protein
MYMTQPVWGVYSFANGLQVPEVKTLRELAQQSANDLLHVVNRLLNDGSESAVALAEELFDAYA